MTNRNKEFWQTFANKQHPLSIAPDEISDNISEGYFNGTLNRVVLKTGNSIRILNLHDRNQNRVFRGKYLGISDDRNVVFDTDNPTPHFLDLANAKASPLNKKIDIDISGERSDRHSLRINFSPDNRWAIIAVHNFGGRNAHLFELSEQFENREKTNINLGFIEPVENAKHVKSWNTYFKPLWPRIGNDQYLIIYHIDAGHKLATIRLPEVRTGDLVISLEPSGSIEVAGEPAQVCLSPNNQLFAALVENKLQVYEVQSMNNVITFDMHSSDRNEQITDIVFGQDNMSLIVKNGSSKIELFRFGKHYFTDIAHNPLDRSIFMVQNDPQAPMFSVQQKGSTISQGVDDILVPFLSRDEQIHAVALAIDESDNRFNEIYWVEGEGNIYSGPLEGLEYGLIIAKAPSGRAGHWQLVVDVIREYIYWTNGREIWRASTKSWMTYQTAEVYISHAESPYPIDLAVDSATGWLYWIDRDLEMIRRYQPDDRDDVKPIDDLYPAPLVREGLALDSATRHLFWNAYEKRLVEAAVIDGPGLFFWLEDRGLSALYDHQHVPAIKDWARFGSKWTEPSAAEPNRFITVKRQPMLGLTIYTAHRQFHTNALNTRMDLEFSLEEETPRKTIEVFFNPHEGASKVEQWLKVVFKFKEEWVSLVLTIHMDAEIALDEETLQEFIEAFLEPHEEDSGIEQWLKNVFSFKEEWASLQEEIQTNHEDLTTLKNQFDQVDPNSIGNNGFTSIGDAHFVKTGDTLAGIAKEHGTTEDTLKALNGISNLAEIEVGQPLKILGSPPAPEDETVNEFAFITWLQQLSYPVKQLSATLEIPSYETQPKWLLEAQNFTKRLSEILGNSWLHVIEFQGHSPIAKMLSAHFRELNEHYGQFSSAVLNKKDFAILQPVLKHLNQLFDSIIHVGEQINQSKEARNLGDIESTNESLKAYRTSIQGAVSALSHTSILFESIVLNAVLDQARAYEQRLHQVTDRFEAIDPNAMGQIAMAYEDFYQEFRALYNAVQTSMAQFQKTFKSLVDAIDAANVKTLVRKVLTFDGQKTYASLGPLYLDLTEGFTLEIRFRTSRVNNSPSLFEFSNGESQDMLKVQLAPNGKIICEVAHEAGESYQRTTKSVSFLEQTWHYLAFVIDSSGIWRIYLDGEPVEWAGPSVMESLLYYAVATRPRSGLRTQCVLGRSTVADSNEFFQGEISMMRCWNKTLNAETISDHAYNPDQDFSESIGKYDRSLITYQSGPYLMRGHLDWGTKQGIDPEAQILHPLQSEGGLIVQSHLLQEQAKELTNKRDLERQLKEAYAARLQAVERLKQAHQLAAAEVAQAQQTEKTLLSDARITREQNENEAADLIQQKQDEADIQRKSAKDQFEADRKSQTEQREAKRQEAQHTRDDADKDVESYKEKKHREESEILAPARADLKAAQKERSKYK